MNDTFAGDEKLYRAVFPPDIAQMYWRKDGTVSSAVFADPKGLSVDRGNYRNDREVLTDMSTRFIGSILRIYVKNCVDIGCLIRYLPSRKNPYHSEIHGSDRAVLLSKQQRYYLSKKAIILS